MKKIYFLPILLILAFTSCKKERSDTEPLAQFTIGDEKADVLVLPEANALFPKNTSLNATSYLWDFGNGTTSTEENPGFSLDTAGDYTVSLTVTSNSWQTSTLSKKIKVIVPIIQQITISNINNWFGYDFSAIKKFNGGDLWVEIKKDDVNKSYPQLEDGSFDYPLFYKSAAAINVPTNNTSPITIQVTDKVILAQLISSKISKYSFNLYVKDTTGTHLLFSSEMHGTSFNGQIDNNSFEWTSQSNNVTVSLSGNYE